MNKIIIIGSLGKDPELRSTQSGIAVTTFSVAVNGKKGEEKTTTWFRVTAWRQLAEICNRYLAKGSKVCVIGSVAVNTFTGKDGTTYANLEVNADEVEFLTPKNEQGYSPAEQAPDNRTGGFVQVDDEELPF